MTKYVAIEGTDGVGKTTQIEKIVLYLKAQGYKVLLTKEPGTPHLPQTLKLRSLMLDAKYEKKENIKDLTQILKNLLSNRIDLTEHSYNLLSKALDEVERFNQLTILAREFISQSIRSIHLEKLIKPSLTEYDWIIQDRGFYSGLAYGKACGFNGLEDLIAETITSANLENRNSILSIYDRVIYLSGEASINLKRAELAKQEFESGDAMESLGANFMKLVDSHFRAELSKNQNATIISVLDKNGHFLDREIIFQKILKNL